MNWAIAMQVSQSLADFLSSLDAGPRGVTDALNAVQKCSTDLSDELDLQQMCLTNDDIEIILPHFQTVAVHVKKLNLFMNEYDTQPCSPPYDCS